MSHPLENTGLVRRGPSDCPQILSPEGQLELFEIGITLFDDTVAALGAANFLLAPAVVEAGPLIAAIAAL